jgi:hypothetical protein|tara:strand:+ start:94 stop:459 length:366 start_codon:yes stop_codon:yes gene_type:complete
MPRRKKPVKAVKHMTKYDRTIVGEYTMVNKRVGAKRFEVPLMEGESMESCDLYRKIATHYNQEEEHILIEPGYYLVRNEVKENPYYANPLDPEEDGYEYNQKGNLVSSPGKHAKELRDGKK